MSFLLQAELVTDDAEHKSSEDPVRWGPQAAVTVSVRWRQAQEDPVGLDDVTPSDLDCGFPVLLLTGEDGAPCRAACRLTLQLP